MFGRALTLFILLLALCASLVAWDAWSFLSSPLAVTDRQIFRVETGSSLRAVSHKLVSEHLLVFPQQGIYLTWYGRLLGVGGQIKAGDYEIQPGMTATELLRNMVIGKTYQHALTIIEGWTFRQMLDAVAGDPDLVHTIKDSSRDAVMKAIGHPGEHPEGRFFPDTYLFPRGTSDIEYLQRAYQSMARIIDSEWPGRVQDLPLKTPYEGLIMASIVQKETALPVERFEIAGVFSRRLKLGMKLQTDPTVIYGIGENFDGDITFADLKRDTPYNTYTRDGLPPTPICMPGRDAIHAALHPAEGDTLYFVAKGDGSHKFSATLEEHNEAVKLYQLKQPVATPEPQPTPSPPAAVVATPTPKPSTTQHGTR